jgi:hypothetical protein
MTAKRFANIRSDFLAAVKASGVTLTLPPFFIQSIGVWRVVTPASAPANGHARKTDTLVTLMTAQPGW